VAANRTHVVAVIPARYASSRLPAKPLADICGKPMIQWVYERTAKARLVDDVIVATDDARIETVVQSFGGRAVMTPTTLQTGTDRIAHVAHSLGIKGIIVNVQGDEPLIEPAMIDQAVEPLLSDSSLVAGTLARKITDANELFDPGVVKVALDKNGDALFFSRSTIPFGRDIDKTTWLDHFTHYKHIGLYVYRSEFLTAYATMPQMPLEHAERLEQLRVLENGYRMRCTITTFDSIAVDTPQDLERVRMIAGKQKS
jgi:3-deoxy-manno-octulosonate cytidylyltransferase (CMP-KDO synthetase)